MYELDKAPQNGTHGAILQGILGYEKILLSFKGSSSKVNRMQSLLGIKIQASDSRSPGEVIATTPAECTTPEALEVCDLTMVYKLADVAALVSKISPRQTTFLPAMPLTVSLPKMVQGLLAKLADFGNLIRAFKEGIRHLASPVLDAGHPSSVRLFKALHRLDTGKRVTKIERNVLLVAAHVAYLKDSLQWSDTQADLTFEDFDQRLSGSLTQEEQKHFQGLDGTVALRFPLQLALFLSPLILLYATALDKKPFDRNHLFRLCQALGADRPESILDIEMRIWQAVFAIVNDPASCQKELQDLANALPDELPVEALKWFHERLNLAGGEALLPAVQADSAANQVDQLIISPQSSDSLAFAVPQGEEGKGVSVLSPHLEFLALVGEEDLIGDVSSPLTSLSSSLSDDEDVANPLSPLSPYPSNDEAGIGPEDEVEQLEESNGMVGHEGVHGDEGDQGMEDALPIEGARDQHDQAMGEKELGKEGDKPGMAGGVGNGTLETEQAGNEVQEDNNAPGKDLLSFEGMEEGERLDIDKDGAEVQETEGTDDELEDVVGLQGQDDDVTEINEEDGGGVNEGDGGGVQGEDLASLLRRSSRPKKPINLKDVGPRLKPIRTNLKRPKTNQRHSKTEQIPQPKDLSEPNHSEVTVPRPLSILQPTPAKRYKGQRMTFYTTDGQPYTFTPEMNSIRELQSLQAFYNAVEANYENNRPLHAQVKKGKDGAEIVVVDERSCLAYFTYDSFSETSPRELQDTFRMKHIMVSGCPYERIASDEEGVQSMEKRMTSIISCQDQSILVEDGDYSSQEIKCTFRQFLDEGLKPDGHILNALNFPLSLAGVKRTRLSACVEAFTATKGRPFCADEIPYPISHFAWGLYSHANARHGQHIDTGGVNTRFDPKSGCKILILGRAPIPKLLKSGGDESAEDSLDGSSMEADEDSPEEQAGDSPYFPFSSNSAFTGQFAVNEPCRPSWAYEAVLLRPGDNFYMRANTVHYVFTPEPSIFHGCHFYATSTLRDTLYGLTHCLMGDLVITNTSHAEGVLLLLRLVHYFHEEFIVGDPDLANPPAHLPDLRTSPGLMDFLHLCSISVFFNVLNPMTYQLDQSPGSDSVAEARYDQYDVNALSEDDRRRFAFARGLSYQLMEWLEAHYVLVGPDDKPVGCSPFFLDLVLHHGKYIINYRRKLDYDCSEDEFIGDIPLRLREMPMMTWDNIMRQVGWALFSVPGMTGEAWSTAAASVHEADFMMAPQEKDEYVLVRREQPNEFKPLPLNPVDDILFLGYSAGDLMYFKGLELFWPIGGPKMAKQTKRKREPSLEARVPLAKRLHQ